MEIKYTKEKGSQAKFTIEFSAAEMQNFFDIAYEANAASVNIAGFRPGKAPRAMIIDSVGRQRLADAAMEQAVRHGYSEAVKKHGCQPIGNPTIKILQQPSFIENSDNGFDYEVEISILPEVKLTKDYKKIKLTPPKKDEFGVSDEEVDKVIDHLRQRNAGFKDITRGAQRGDRLEITFKGFDGRVIVEQLSSSNHPIIMGNNTLIPGFEDKIIGIKTGEHKEFKLKFPKEHFAPQFKNKEFRFEVKAEKVQEVILPKLDNEFAKKFGLKDLAELKKRLKENIASEKKERYEGVVANEVTQGLAQMTRTELPKILVDGESERLRQSIAEMIKKQGITLEQYLANIKSTKEKFEEDLARQAAKNVLVGLALREVAKAEKIKLDKEETLEKVIKWLVEVNIKEKKTSR
jgi:trigger factor